MAPPTLAISLISSPLPTCKPNLMPFHIDYTGPAAVSTYMRVEKLKTETVAEEKERKVDDGKPVALSAQDTMESVVFETQGSLDEQKMDVDATAEPHLEAAAPSTVTDVSTSASEAPTLGVESHSPLLSEIVPSLPTPPILSKTDTESTLVVESQNSLASTNVTTPSISAPPIEDIDKRTVSTFRGRTIHGLSIDLPEGYVGLFLKGAGDEATASNAASVAKVKAKGKAAKKASDVKEDQDVEMDDEERVSRPRRRGRLTRSAAPRKGQVVTISDDEEPKPKAQEPIIIDDDLIDPESEALPDEEPLRMLVPQAQFSSFTLWHADRMVDKTNDEYFRTLTEWLNLAHEIHRTDLNVEE